MSDRPPLSLKDRAFAGGAWQFVASGSIGATQIAVFAFLARRLSPEAFGNFAAASIVLAFVTVGCLLGLPATIVQREHDERRFLASANAVGVTMGIVGAAVLVLGAPIAVDVFGVPGRENVFRVMGIVLFARAARSVGTAMLHRELAFQALGRVQISSYLLGYVSVAVIHGSLRPSVWTLVFATIAYECLFTIAVLSRMPPPAPRLPRRGDLHAIAGFGGGVALANAAATLARQADDVVVARFLGTTSLGIYERSFAILARLDEQIVNTTQSVSLASLARRNTDRDAQSAALLTGQTLLHVVLISSSIVGSVVADEIVHVLLGDQWDDAIAPLRLMLLSLSFLSGARVFDTVPVAVGNTWALAKRRLIGLALIVVGALAGEPWGVTGVAAGSGIAIVATYGLSTDLAARSLGVTRARLLVPLRAGALAAPLIAGPALIAIVLARTLAGNDLFTLGVGLTALVLSALNALRFDFALGPDPAMVRVQLRRIPVVGPVLGSVSTGGGIPAPSDPHSSQE
ncbi:MAG: oligosaccharide flippase family protein [Acidimicrobiales bacterium]